MNLKNILYPVILATTIPSALAQTKDTTLLSEVILKENRLQIPFSKQNRNIQIITAEDIKNIPHNSINEILSYIGGVDIRQRGPFGGQADVSIDGGTFEQTTILLNGVKIGDPQTAHHSLNIPVPVEAIDRIEVIKGSAARIFGVNSLTGAINIVTKHQQNNMLTAQLQTGSSFLNNEEHAGKYYGKSIQLAGTIHTNSYRQGIYLSHDGNNGQRYNSKLRNNKVYYEGENIFNSRNSLRLNIGYIDNAFGANGFYAAPGDKESYEIVQTTFTSLESKHQLSERFSISPRLSLRYNTDDYRYYRDRPTVGRSLHRNHVYQAELNSTWKQHFGDFGFGAEIRDEKIKSTNIGHYDRQNYGGYVEFRTDQIRNLNVNVSSYINYNSNYHWQFYPGIDIGYELTPHWRIVANMGSSQRIPSFTDLYLQQKGNIGNPDLTSENARQIEGGIKYINDQTVFQAGYFYRKIDHFIDWQRTDAALPWQPENIDKFQTEGYHASLRYRINEKTALHQFFIQASYNYLKPETQLQHNAIQSKYAIESLRQQAILGLQYKFHGWMLSVMNRYNERINYKSYFVTDSRVAYQAGKVNIHLDAQNIFNTQYMESGAIPMPTRWFTFGVKYHVEM